MEKEFPKGNLARRTLMRIQQEDFNSFAELSGDRNPVHFSYESARSLGYPQPIFFGAGLFISALKALSLDPECGFQSLKIRWLKPSFGGDLLQIVLREENQVFFLSVEREGELILSARFKTGEGLRASDLYDFSRRFGNEDPGPFSVWTDFEFSKESFAKEEALSNSLVSKSGKARAGFFQAHFLLPEKPISPPSPECAHWIKDQKFLALGASQGMGLGFVQSWVPWTQGLTIGRRPNVGGLRGYRSQDLTKPWSPEILTEIGALQPQIVLLAAQDGYQTSNLARTNWEAGHRRMIVDSLKPIEHSLKPGATVIFCSSIWSNNTPSHLEIYANLKKEMEGDLARFVKNSDQDLRLIVLRLPPTRSHLGYRRTDQRELSDVIQDWNGKIAIAFQSANRVQIL